MKDEIKGLNRTENFNDNEYGAIPLYSMKEETVESWNEECRKLFLKHYIEEHGKEPDDFDIAFNYYNLEVQKASCKMSHEELIKSIRLRNGSQSNQPARGSLDSYYTYLQANVNRR
jgi:hypothetical protein